VPTTFIQTVHGSNMTSLLSENHEGFPSTLDQLYEPQNPETGNRQLHNVTFSLTPFLNGDTYYLSVGGGAGYGDVVERDPAMVMEDLKNGLTTHWAARNIYHVAYDTESLRVDDEGTEKLREEEIAARKARGRPYDEFEREWLQQRPSGALIKYYGGFPHPKPQESFSLF
jgi:acetophenone carboxylase